MNLRSGYTTGTCATAAAKAAAMILCDHDCPSDLTITLPSGSPISQKIIDSGILCDSAFAVVAKDSGDDPDVTHQALIIASVKFNHLNHIRFFAGEGVGTVTKPGLALAVGEAAINPVPRQMICHALRAVTPLGLDVTISIPNGRELAEKTFNRKLGIIGGLSIIGTTGIVKPFSAPAITASLRCSLNVAAACEIHSPIFVPGNIGERAALRHTKATPDQIIQVSNHWGMMLKEAATLTTFKQILVLGHPGKLAKLIAGNWNTHSSQSDSAVATVMHLASSLIVPCFDPPTTVDAIFSLCTPAQSLALGNALAHDVAHAISHYSQSSQSFAVMLINLKGDLIGSYGNLSPWL